MVFFIKVGFHLRVSFLFSLFFSLAIVSLFTTPGHLHPPFLSARKVLSRNIIVQAAGANAGQMVVQYDSGDTRILGCPYWAHTLEEDCHPDAYRQGLILAWGLPNFILAAVTLCGAILFCVCGRRGRQEPLSQYLEVEKRKQEVTHPKDRSVSETMISALLSAGKEGSMKEDLVTRPSEECFNTVEPKRNSHMNVSQRANDTVPRTTTLTARPPHWHNDVVLDGKGPGVEGKKEVVDHKNIPQRRSRATHWSDVCSTNFTVASLSWGTVCELFFFPWFLALVLVICTGTACGFAVHHTSAIVSQMNFLSSQVDQAQDVLLQLGNRLDTALRHVDCGTEDSTGNTTRRSRSLLPSLHAAGEEEKNVTGNVSNHKELSFSLSATLPQKKWNIHLFPQLPDELSSLRRHTIDYLINMVQNKYLLSIWTYCLLCIVFVLSIALFLGIMRWWDRHMLFLVIGVLFVLCSALTWVWVGYHSIALQFLKDSCLEIQYFTKQKANVLPVITLCSTTSSFGHPSPFLSPSTRNSNKSGLSSSNSSSGSSDLSSMEEGETMASLSSSSFPLSVPPSRKWSGSRYFRELYRTYIELITSFACHSTPHNAFSFTAAATIRSMEENEKEDVMKGTASQAHPSSPSMSFLSYCRKALLQSLEKINASNVPHPSSVATTSPEDDCVDPQGRRAAVDYLLSNLTFSSAVTSCEGILAVSVPPLLLGCSQAVASYESLIQNGGVIGLLAVLGAVITAGISSRRRFLLYQLYGR